MSLLEQRRAGFEAWSGGEGIPYANGRYASPTLNMEWVIWNAALDSVVIELPKVGICAMTNELIGYQRGLRDAAKAIEASGLKVKP